MRTQTLLCFSIGALLGLACISACGDDDSASTTPDGGSMKPTGASGGAPGTSGRGGTGGSGGKAAKAGTGGSATGGVGGSTPTDPGATDPMMMMGLTCTEPAPTDPVTCGGQTCEAPSEFAMNPCVVPCCIKQGGQERCASKSTAMGFSTECSLLATPDPTCPDVDSNGMPLRGCCNAVQHKCGIVSTLRPGCITESSLVTLPSPLQSCGTTSGDDAGVGPDAG
jgi:hypothetical protein